MEKKENNSAGLRDITIGFSESASYMFVFACALVAGGLVHNMFLNVMCIAGFFLGIVYGLIGFMTAKDLIHTQKRSKDILEDGLAMQKAIEKKKAFLKNLNMTSEIIDLSENEVREESEEEASMNIAPVSSFEVMIISLRMGIAALLAAAVMIFPFLMKENLHQGFVISSSIILPLIALSLFIKSKLTGVSPWLGALGNTIITAIAGACLYFLIQWIRS